MAQTKEELKAQLGEADVLRAMSAEQAETIERLSDDVRRLSDFHSSLSSVLRNALHVSVQHILDEVDSRDSNVWLEQQLEHTRQINDLKAQLDVAQKTSEGRRKVLFEKSEELRQLWTRTERAEEAARLNAEENARLKCEMYGSKGVLLKRLNDFILETDADYLRYLHNTSAGFTYNFVSIAIDLQALANEKKEKGTDGSSKEAQSQG